MSELVPPIELKTAPLQVGDILVGKPIRSGGVEGHKSHIMSTGKEDFFAVDSDLGSHYLDYPDVPNPDPQGNILDYTAPWVVYMRLQRAMFMDTVMNSFKSENPPAAVSRFPQVDIISNRPNAIGHIDTFTPEIVSLVVTQIIPEILDKRSFPEIYKQILIKRKDAKQDQLNKHCLIYPWIPDFDSMMVHRQLETNNFTPLEKISVLLKIAQFNQYISEKGLMWFDQIKSDNYLLWRQPNGSLVITLCDYDISPIRSDAIKQIDPDPNSLIARINADFEKYDKLTITQFSTDKLNWLWDAIIPSEKIDSNINLSSYTDLKDILWKLAAPNNAEMSFTIGCALLQDMQTTLATAYDDPVRQNKILKDLIDTYKQGLESPIRTAQLTQRLMVSQIVSQSKVEAEQNKTLIAQSKLEVQQLTSQENALQTQIKDSQTQLQMVNTNLSDLLVQHSQLTGEISQLEIQKQEQLAQLSIQGKQKTAELEQQFQTDLKIRQTKLAELDAQIHIKEAEKDKIVKEQEDLITKKALQLRIRRHLQEINTRRKVQNVFLQQQGEQLEAQVNSYHEHISILHEQIAQLESKINLLETRGKSLSKMELVHVLAAALTSKDLPFPQEVQDEITNRSIVELVSSDVDNLISRAEIVKQPVSADVLFKEVILRYVNQEDNIMAVRKHLLQVALSTFPDRSFLEKYNQLQEVKRAADQKMTDVGNTLDGYFSNPNSPYQRHGLAIYRYLEPKLFSQSELTPDELAQITSTQTLYLLCEAESGRLALQTSNMENEIMNKYFGSFQPVEDRVKV